MQAGKISRSLWVLITILILVSACAPATQSTPISVIDNATSTPSPIPTATRTALPTATQTASITPLPTIPTFTPTFDVSTIVTVTPAPKAECPIENSNIVPKLKLAETNACLENARKNQADPFACANQNIYNDILDYLNLGGEINKIINQLKSFNQTENSTFAYEDLTGDDVPEFVFHDSNQIYGGYYFYSCNSGKYNIQYKFDEVDDGIKIFSIQDLNADGINEITFTVRNTFAILSWNTSTYIELIWIREFGKQYQVTDINNDGIMEIILSGISQPYWEPHDVMWRQYSAIYSWNGSSYDLSMKVFKDPTYRFQTIQDADFASKQNEFDRALNLFEEAILNKNLKSLSPEIKINLQEVWASQLQGKPIPTPISEDFSEHPRLAAYAYYRIMLIHLVQGHETEATTVYSTLQEKFGNDQYGRPYVEMATAFWNAYQSTHKMYDGCAAAIEYAAEHPEILTPLGSDYHGLQSHQYKPEDVCPFR